MHSLKPGDKSKELKCNPLNIFVHFNKPRGLSSGYCVLEFNNINESNRAMGSFSLRERTITFPGLIKNKRYRGVTISYIIR